MKKDVTLSDGDTFWNYRVFRYKRKVRSIPIDIISYGVHETYYDEHGQPNGWTKDPIIVGDSVKELLYVLKMIKNDIQRFPEILDYEEDKSD